MSKTNLTVVKSNLIPSNLTAEQFSEIGWKLTCVSGLLNFMQGFFADKTSDDAPAGLADICLRGSEDLEWCKDLLFLGPITKEVNP